MGWRLAPLRPPRGIQKLLSDSPEARTFATQTNLGSDNADVIVRLDDGRLLAIECKGSNSEINSRKRLNKEGGAERARLDRALRVGPDRASGGAARRFQGTLRGRVAGHADGDLLEPSPRRPARIRRRRDLKASAEHPRRVQPEQPGRDARQPFAAHRVRCRE